MLGATYYQPLDELHQAHERFAHDRRLFYLVWLVGTLSLFTDLPVKPRQVVIGTVLTGISAYFGPRVAKPLGLGLPFVEAWLAGRRPPLPLPTVLIQATVIGILMFLAVVLIGIAIFWPGMPKLIPQSELGQHIAAPLWQRLLTPVEAGIAEEIVFRLGLLTLTVWLFNEIIGARPRRPSNATFWCANILVSVLFALVHLLRPPASLDRAVWIGLGSLVFGYQYRRYGLESAITTHFVYDMLIPLLSLTTRGV